jgi:hypothetical protein
LQVGLMVFGSGSLAHGLALSRDVEDKGNPSS